MKAFLISCAQDGARRAGALASAATHGVHVTWVRAVDARDGDEVFHPFADLIPDQFWGGDEIKPGALACFISHRLAWAQFLESGDERALFLEDDSRIIGKIKDPGGGVVFVNDRLVDWAHAFGALDVEALVGLLGDRGHLPELAKAPGADGYILSREAAERALHQSAMDRLCCGVDWYLLGLAAGVSPSENCVELAQMAQMLGKRRPILSGAVSATAFLKNDRHWASSIGHSKTISIDALRAKLS